MWLLYIALFVLLIFLIDRLMYDKRQLELTEKFNGPRRWPIVGNAFSFLGLNVKVFYDFEMELGRTHFALGSRILRIWVFNMLEIGVNCPKYIETIMTSPKFLSKSSQYSFLHGSLGEGLLFSTNQKWFTRRRIITPTFHFKILEQFFEVFKKHNTMLMDKIAAKADGRAFDIFPLVTASVMNSLCETAMGCEIDSENHEYFAATKELCTLTGTRFLTPWLKPQFLYNFSSNKRDTDRCSKVLRDFTAGVIERRREKLQLELEREGGDNNNDDEVGLKRKMCLLDVLLRATVDGESLSNEDILEEVGTFTFAGHDTTSNAICFTLFCIAKHPEVQQKLSKEIEEVIGDGEVTFSIVNELKYLDMVIKEAMRLYTPVPIISRRLFEEVEINDVTFPANCNVNLSLTTMFRDPTEFENPLEFIPERFLKNFNNPYLYIPFSAGQRNCIGQKFALYNVKNHLINIMQKYELVYGNIEPQLMINITLKCDGLFVGFRERK